MMSTLSLNRDKELRIAPPYEGKVFVVLEDVVFR